jgi:hypothetical protein
MELVAVVVELMGAGGAAAGLGEDRLKTELVFGGIVGLESGGGEVCDTGAERSKRSPMADELGAGLAGAGADAGGGDEKAPKPPKEEFEGCF